MYVELFIEFFRLGLVAFGGPAAHVSMMHERFVEKKQWLSDKHFLDLVSLSSVIPGPSSTELTLLIGRYRGGILGLWIAGISFILPALSMVLGISVLYISYGDLSEVSLILDYISPVIIAIIMYAIVKLTNKILSSYMIAFWIIFSFLIAFVFNQVFVFLIVSIFAGLLEQIKHKIPKIRESMSLIMILWIFFQIGATLYGSGYVLASYLETFFVDAGILSFQEVIDAITVGQITPGPVFTTAGFVGFVISGNIFGGLLGAFGIFLPGFLLITFLYRWIEYLRNSTWFQPILAALNAAAIALMLHVVVNLTLVDVTWLKLILMIVSFILLWSKKVTSSQLLVFVISISTIFAFT